MKPDQGSSTSLRGVASTSSDAPPALKLTLFVCQQCSPVRDGVGVPRLQGVGRPFQSVQLVEQQHVECHQHHQASRKDRGQCLDAPNHKTAGE